MDNDLINAWTTFSLSIIDSTITLETADSVYDYHVFNHTAYRNSAGRVLNIPTGPSYKSVYRKFEPRYRDLREYIYCPPSRNLFTDEVDESCLHEYHIGEIVFILDLDEEHNYIIIPIVIQSLGAREVFSSRRMFQYGSQITQPEITGYEYEKCFISIKEAMLTVCDLLDEEIYLTPNTDKGYYEVRKRDMVYLDDEEEKLVKQTSIKNQLLTDGPMYGTAEERIELSRMENIGKQEENKKSYRDFIKNRFKAKRR